MTIDDNALIEMLAAEIFGVAKVMEEGHFGEEGWSKILLCDW